MRRTLFAMIALAVSICLPLGALGQEMPIAKPGPEHEKLKLMEGEWDATMKMGGQESKGTLSSKFDLGGLWLVSSFEADMFGMKYYGKGAESYNAGKKKYVGAWIDSMTAHVMTYEGTFDDAGKVQTVMGESVGPDGKPVKIKMVTEFKDKDHHDWAYFMITPDGKEVPTMTISYKRKK